MATKTVNNSQFSDSWDPSPEQAAGYETIMRWHDNPRRAQVMKLAGYGGTGKALALDTPMAVWRDEAVHWTTMENVDVGDYVIGGYGEPTRVCYASPNMYDRKCYRVRFSDGESIVADAEHLWYVVSLDRRRALGFQGKSILPDPRVLGDVRTTEEIRRTQQKRGMNNHAVRTVPLRLPERDYEYLALASAHHSVDSGRLVFSDGSPLVPRNFCWNQDFLRHLMERIGRNHYPRSSLEINAPNGEFAASLVSFLSAMGIDATVTKARGGWHGERPGEDTRVTFSLPWKLSNQAHHQTTNKNALKYITAVEDVPSVTVRCIMVECQSAAYLAGEKYTLTHNTTLTGHLAREMQAKGSRIAFATLTGRASQVLSKSLAAAGVTPAYVGTLHRLLYRPIFDAVGGVTGWAERDELPYDFVVNDEASMTPQDVVDKLLRFDKPVLFAGDLGQLPPVGQTSSVLENPDVRLEKIHRQAEGNPIIRACQMVREGAPMHEITEMANEDLTGSLLWSPGSDGLIDATEFIQDNDGFIVVHTNRRRANVNGMCRRMRRTKGPPVTGEAILCLRNYFLPDGRFVANGTRVVLTTDAAPHGKDQVKMQVTDGTDSFEVAACAHQFGRDRTFMDLHEIPGHPGHWSHVGALWDFGDAVTCHKAQSTQADHVAVVVERSLGVMPEDERRRWLYTAFSRASKRLMLVTLD